LPTFDGLDKLPEACDADAAGDLDCVVQLNTSSPRYAVIKDGTCAVANGSSEDAAVTVMMEDEDLAAMLRGELNGMTAFMTDKLKIDCDLIPAILAQRITTIFNEDKLA